jgi:small subunit ribosomal protein S9
MTQVAERHSSSAATGRRKNAVARVVMRPGSGRVVVNERPVEQFFPVAIWRQHLFQPLELADSMGRFDIQIRVSGGGVMGQAGAVRHALARALLIWDPNLRPLLKRNGLLTRDPREKERKKYGQRGARARFQYSKR